MSGWGYNTMIQGKMKQQPRHGPRGVSAIPQRAPRWRPPAPVDTKDLIEQPDTDTKETSE